MVPPPPYDNKHKLQILEFKALFNMTLFQPSIPYCFFLFSNVTL